MSPIGGALRLMRHYGMQEQRHTATYLWRRHPQCENPGQPYIVLGDNQDRRCIYEHQSVSREHMRREEVCVPAC